MESDKRAVYDGEHCAYGGSRFCSDECEAKAANPVLRRSDGTTEADWLDLAKRIG